MKLTVDINIFDDAGSYNASASSDMRLSLNADIIGSHEQQVIAMMFSIMLKGLILEYFKAIDKSTEGAI